MVWHSGFGSGRALALGVVVLGLGLAGCGHDGSDLPRTDETGGTGGSSGGSGGDGGNAGDSGDGGDGGKGGTGTIPEGGAPSCGDGEPGRCVETEDCAAPDSDCGRVACTGGECVYESEAPGTPCAQSGGHYCDGLAPATCVPTLLSVLAGRTGGAGDADGIGSYARLSYPSGISYDGAGSLFITDGTRVRRVELVSGRVTTLAGALPPANASQLPPRDGVGTEASFGLLGDVSAGGDGFVYVSDTENHTIRRVDARTAEVTTLAGSPGIAGGSDGIGAEASFTRPGSLASDGEGGLWVLDVNGLRRVEGDTGAVTSVPGVAGRAVASDGRGNVFVLGERVIERLDVTTGALSAVFDSDRVGGEGGTRFSGITAATVDDRGILFVLQSFAQPLAAAGLVSDGRSARCDALVQVDLSGSGSDVAAAEGYLYVTTTDGTLIQVSPGTGASSAFVGSPRPMDPMEDGVGTNARFQAPYDLVSDGAGAVYVMELLGGVRKLDLVSSAVSTIAGVDGGVGAAVEGGKLYSFEDGELIAADLATGEVSTIAGAPMMNGSQDGTGPLARFGRDAYTAADGSGYLFVADAGDNQMIRRVEIATGIVTTLAGAPGSPSARLDGVGTAARFGNLTSIAIGGGNLYVADGSTIREIVLSSGAVTTLAGKDQVGQPTLEDGIGAAATLLSPGAMSLDASGNLYFVDWGTVRRLELATGGVTTVVGVSGSRGVGLGALPGSLTSPSDVLALPSGDLLIIDEKALLLARF